MDWLLEHGDDPNIDDPLTPAQITQIARVHRMMGGPAPPSAPFSPDAAVNSFSMNFLRIFF